MTDSQSTILAILFGLGIFAVIMAIGWRSVQKRRILRMQDSDGHETIIIASEDDEISSIVSTTTEDTQPPPESAQSVDAVDPAAADTAPAPEFGRKHTKR